MVEPLLQIKFGPRPKVVVAPTAGHRHYGAAQVFLRQVFLVLGITFEADWAHGN